MPIEIKEVIIKTTVEKEPFSEGFDESEQRKMEDLKREILKNCEVLISKVIKNQNRR